MTTDSSFIGRHTERRALLDLVQSPGAELVSVTGRRRVGKTFLIKQTLGPLGIDFMVSGLKDGKMKEQMIAFDFSLALEEGRDPTGEGFESWQVAFIQLISHLRRKEKKDKLIVFLDELPWLATPRSGFLRAFSFFWNNWAVDQNILVVICGSAASWMIQKVVNDKGGLHNRITKRIALEPFTLAETKEYLDARNFPYSKRAILEVYMSLGGIPFYLRDLANHLTPAENLDALCLEPSGSLYGEFNNLYPALFEKADRHIEIVRALAEHPYGLERSQLLAKTSMKDGGSFTRALDELTFSGFVDSYTSFNRRKKQRIYRLLDEYSLFYLRFIEPNKGEGKGTWRNLRQRPTYAAWSGYAFENVGLRHIEQIKQALRIGGVYSSQSTFYHPGNDDYGRLQIDLLIDRADNAINICEFKHSENPIALSKEQLQRIEDRRQAFGGLTQTSKILFSTLVVSNDLVGARHRGAIGQVVGLDDLFL